MSATIEVKVPDIGDYKDVPIIEIHVKPGDTVKAEDALITLESDKATMDVPSPAAGVVKEVRVNIGDKVAEGSLVLLLEAAATVTTAAAPSPAAVAAPAPSPATAPAVAAPAAPAPAAPAAGSAADFRPTEAEPTTAPPQVQLPSPADMVAASGGVKAHASPSVRQFARGLGVDVTKVRGSGPKGRITQADIQAFVKGVLAGATSASATAAPSGPGLNLLPWPQVDFAKFGPVEVKPLSRIKKISGPNLARNWVMIPAVTYHEDADITDLEALRVQLNKENEKAGIKVTMLAFIIKAVVAALKKYPDLNSSLDGDNQVFKNYWHIGFAADTPNGLMVPVLKNADQKGVVQIAQETSDLAKKARDGKLGPADMQGATFTISSVGGIGGTAFSPIVNAPEVAILGVSKSSMKPVWDGKQFVPRLTVPLSLSADHRVIDGALATRFNAYLAQILSDFRRVSL
jgi:pyruvate dehydrogenase E2 component (dihydrolipoamide acetyltransferase)